MKLTTPKQGYDATIETDFGTFHLNNFHNVDPEEDGIDVYDEDEKFVGEITELGIISFPDDIEDKDEVETYLKDAEAVAEYIEQNLL